MERIQLEILGLTSSNTESGSFALVLGERHGQRRRLPIIIGIFEAQAIAIEIEKINPNRPMTHDLFCNLADEFDITVQEILITDIHEGVFYAKMFCSNGIKMAEIDTRPSDAVALALRFGVPIYTFEDVLNVAGIELDHDEEEYEVSNKEKTIEETSSEELQQKLEEAIEVENYELAAVIRDELQKRG